jgi:hypothetical protein
MLRLNQHIVALVLWLAFAFNIERLGLDLGQTESLESPLTLYAALVVCTVLGLVLPQWRRLSLWHMQIVGIVAFAIARSLSTRPLWGQNATFLSLFELVALLITASLAYAVGRSTADFVETVRAMMFEGPEGRVYDGGEADRVVTLEMQSARRSNRPLSVLVMEVCAEDVQAARSATAKEIEHILTQRYGLIGLMQLLSTSIRRTDVVLNYNRRGRLVLLAPDIAKEQADVLAQRLGDVARQRLGFRIRSGAASFPAQGATFEEVVHQAEQSLQLDRPAPADEGVEAARELGVDQLYARQERDSHMLATMQPSCTIKRHDRI